MNGFLQKLTPLLAAAALVGCSDGPYQTFSPTPDGAAGLWNNGNTPPAALDAGQGFGSSYPTTGKTTLCSTDLRRERWSWMLLQPVVPPRKYAGLDMAKNDLWEGLTIEDAESPPSDPNASGGGLCGSVPLGFQGGCPSGIGNCNQNYWGNNREVQFSWNLGTHIVDQMILTLGYLGSMKFTSRDGKHIYEIKIGDVPKKDDMPFLIDWNGHPSTQITEMFNAAMITYGPPAGIPWDTDSTDCGADGNCLVLNASGQTIFGFRPLVIYVQGVSGVPQPALSTPTQFYNFFAKFEPYGNLPQVVKLDAEGPTATGVPSGARAGVSCTQRIGITFGEYRQNCIQVHGPAGAPDSIDIVNLNKIQNGLTHDQEHWAANVVGVNQNFTSNRVSNNPDQVVLDTDKPQDADLGQDFFFDLRAKGHVRNDYNANNKLDLRGSSLLFVEWARLLLLDINKQMKASGAIPQNQPPMRLGDPQCTGFDGMGNPNFKLGCSGIEGLIIPYVKGTSLDFTKDASCVNPATCLDPGQNWDTVGLYGVSQIKPGDKVGAFCVDPGKFTDCYQPANSPFFAAQQWVTRMLGKGNVNSLPVELQDRRYYYKWFGVAFVKYIKAYSDYAQLANRDNWPCSTLVDMTCVNGGLGPSDVAKQFIDLESLFFDNSYTAVFDKFEYIDRENLGHGQEGTPAEKYNFIPWDFEYGIDLVSGNQRYDNWYRRMDREELAMYASMLTDKTHTPGQENNINFTNLFGSSVISSIWPNYQCAIGAAGDPLAAGYPCSGPPPLDSTNMTPCGAGNTCAGTQKCVSATTYENGIEKVCGGACNFAMYENTGCAQPNQTCVLSSDGKTEACVDMMMDLNGPTAPNPHPILSYYPSVWTRTPFSRGHSPIVLHNADKYPSLGVAKITIPNFAGGPYTNSPQILSGSACPMNWMLDGSGKSCVAPLYAGTGMMAPSFSTLTPWLEVQAGVGFSFPIDGQHDQLVTTGQMQFTGVLETYIVDYTPWTDNTKPSCVTDGICNAGYSCDATTKNCVAKDDTVAIQAIEASDFLGSVFVCQDPLTGDVLHVRQYDSALHIIEWMAGHPGGWSDAMGAIQPSAQVACQIIVRYSPYNNYIDFITSKTNGVKLNINQGAGLGRVVDALLYDSGTTQTP